MLCKIPSRVTAYSDTHAIFLLVFRQVLIKRALEQRLAVYA